MLAEIYVCFICLQLIFATGETQGVDGQLHLRYVGCFKGNGSSPVIDTPLQNDLTIEQCIQKCYNMSSPRMTFAGLSNGDICVCSDHFGAQVSETECKSKCAGSDNQYCGGVYARSNPIYSVYAVCEIGFHGGGCKRQCHCKDQLPCERRTGLCQSGCEDHWDGVSCNKSKVDIKNEFIGCYNDNKTKAAMDVKNPGGKTGSKLTQNSVEFCIEICSSYNYSYAGMQYGYDCNCGEQYDRYGISLGCNFSCPGNKSQICGGKWANSVYHACPTGFYGRNCANRCNCANGTRCSKAGCPSGGCKPGWKGATCSSRDCLDNNGDCGPYLQCTAIDLGYVRVNECRCEDGYLKLESECIKISQGQDEAASIIGGVLGFVAIAIFIILIVFLALRKRKSRRRENKNRLHQAVLYTPDRKCANHDTKPVIELLPANAVCTNIDEVSSKIRVKDFPDHLKRKRAIIGNLEKEFQSIPLLDETKPIVVGKKMPKKNRFKNILPYDCNRVILSKDDNQSDNSYINASFITGYDKDEKLIATQGPTAETVKDFWKMIYETEACTIVMITNLIENAKRKCECYWPQSEDNLEIEDMSVVLKLIEEWPDYVIRHLQLSKTGKTMDIKQWHFTMWPDHGVPSNIKGFLDFRRSVRQSLSSDKYTIIHCSAGVGRTGTFMAINYLLEQAETEGCLDVVACLRCLRDQRPLMIQTLEQYEFIYDALSIEFRVGKTTIEAKHFDKIYRSLSTKDQESGKTQLEIQFEVLEEQQSQTSENSYTVLPNSGNVPAQLKTVAVFVQSWKRKNAYIVSDYPDQESRNYFWEICNDYDIKFLIYIEDEKSECFLPTQQGMTSSVGNWCIVCNLVTKETYGYCYSISLTHISQSEYSNTATSMTKEVKVLHVKLFVSGKPKLQCDVLYSVHNAIKGFTSVNEPNSTPVAIVNGAAGSLGGLFVAAFNAFDMLTERNEVDIFQTVYGVKQSRSQLIDSLATYEELHSIINHRIAYTAASSVYGNISY